ncbi:MAG: NAD(P)-dependent oxidoreductase [Candidatus Diapherotrites archaeon]|nr:NAD(P)-dependent oxidoreductase [Candidatus Diapherotrites archaeon]
MKILVTGSNGMIGKKLLIVLRNKNHYVREFDLSNGKDITKLQDCLPACKDMQIVVHCAATLDEDNSKLFEINVQGTKNIFEASVKNKVERVIHLSSVGVYGNAETELTEESEKRPVTKYEKSKTKAEEIVEEFQEQISVTMLRPAIVIGPNKYWKEIIRKIKSGFPVIGSGENTWQTVYSEDVVNAIVFCIEHEEETSGETFNIAEEKASTLNEVVETLASELKINKKTKHIPVWMGTILGFLNGIVCVFTRKPNILSSENIQRIIRNRRYSISKIKQLGWKPKYDMKTALKITVKELEK